MGIDVPMSYTFYAVNIIHDFQIKSSINMKFHGLQAQKKEL